MAVAVKTYLTLSGLYKLSELMFKDEEILYIPKEKWIYKNGRYVEDISIDKSLVPHYKIWRGEPIDAVYSLETCMINTSWIRKFKDMNIPVFDVPMIEWVEKRSFNSGSYNIFDKIICLNNYCYSVFSEKYNKAELVTPDFLYPQYDSLCKKENIVYHQASCSTSSGYKNTDLAIKAFLSTKNHDYKMVITGILSDIQQKNIKNENIDYKGIVSYEEVLNIFRKSKIYLSPSSQEGLSIPLYEAKANGCKIITSNFSPMKEMGDYICDITFEDVGRFMYPKIQVNFNSIVKNLLKAIKDTI
jgi:glycosyltransferase involved in cell wall biosynthesis